MKISYPLNHQKTFLIIGMIVIGLVSLMLVKRWSKIANELPKIAESTQREIKFSLRPTVVVKVGNEAVNEPLIPLRRTIASNPLRVHQSNPRYFTDGSGKAIYLTGSHTWSNLQDNGLTNPPPVFNYEKFLDFLTSNNHNFFRLWVWEQARWSSETTQDYWIAPLPYQRLGSEMALDGQPKFDLIKFERAYFDRLRQRVIAARQKGIYVSIMLFNGWTVEDKLTTGNPWIGHPYNRNNNINGIDGDPNKNDRGEETHTLQIPAVTAIQEAYVRKVIDTVNDLDNVLYEISNESGSLSRDWQYHMISYVKSYQATKPKQHPVGMTSAYPNGKNSDLLASPADWISPNGDLNNPPITEGKKVIIADTDHLCGICGDRQWVWKSLTRGENPSFMDVYDGTFLIADSLPTTKPLNYQPWIGLRQNLGYALTYAERMNLVAMKPSKDLASTGYCLANPVKKGAEYLVYLPLGGTVIVDLSAAQGELAVEWLNPDSGMITSGIKTTGGGNRTFVAPFDGDAVLYLKGV